MFLTKIQCNFNLLQANEAYIPEKNGLAPNSPYPEMGSFVSGAEAIYQGACLSTLRGIEEVILQCF